MAAILSSRPPDRGDPDADTAVAPFAADVEAGEGADNPFLEVVDKAAEVRRAPLQVEHDIGHPLARPVIGVLAAAAAGVDREAVGLPADRPACALVPAV